MNKSFLRVVFNQPQFVKRFKNSAPESSEIAVLNPFYKLLFLNPTWFCV